MFQQSAAWLEQAQLVYALRSFIRSSFNVFSRHRVDRFRPISQGYREQFSKVLPVYEVGRKTFLTSPFNHRCFPSHCWFVASLANAATRLLDVVPLGLQP